MRIHCIILMFNFSLTHAAFDKRLDQSAQSVYLIEKSVENSFQFIVQLTALASGAIKETDYIYETTTSTGKHIQIPTSKLKRIDIY